MFSLKSNRISVIRIGKVQHFVEQNQKTKQIQKYTLTRIQKRMQINETYSTTNQNCKSNKSNNNKHTHTKKQEQNSKRKL